MSEYDKWEAVLPEADQGNISVAANGREVSIVGSQDSLTSLAIQLLSLAQGEEWRGDHIPLGSFRQPDGKTLNVTIRKI